METPILQNDASFHLLSDKAILEALSSTTEGLSDEAALTGESLPAEKTADVLDQDAPPADRTNMVFMSTGVETAGAWPWSPGQAWPPNWARSPT